MRFDLGIRFPTNKEELEEFYNELKEILIMKKLWYEPPHKLSTWNPMIYETCALYGQHYNIYQCFLEFIKRVLEMENKKINMM